MWEPESPLAYISTVTGNFPEKNCRKVNFDVNFIYFWFQISGNISELMQKVC
jgi:hypothetical protein